MVNPTEDIVNVWLQEVCNHFTMSNIVVPKPTRERMGRKIGGGRGQEIDLISTDGKNHYWIEVSVPSNPRLPNKKVRLEESINITRAKFSSEKVKYLTKRFRQISFRKWFVYSPKLFSQKLKEESRYCDALKQKDIKAISFEKVLKEVYNKLNYMGYDVTRNYLFLLKKFDYSSTLANKKIRRVNI